MKELNIQSLSHLKEFDNHAKVYWIDDPEYDLRGAISIHKNIGNFPSFGATRYWYYTNQEEIIRESLRLSKTMSYKSALAGLPYGGAKAVLVNMNKNSGSKRKMLERYAYYLNQLNGKFITGTDMGLNSEDVKTLKKYTKHVVGSKVNPSYYTMEGLILGIKTTLNNNFNDDKIANHSFAIQGIGKIGYLLAERLINEGARVMVADIDKTKIKKIQTEYPEIKTISPLDIHKQNVDVFCPCATGGCLNKFTVQEIKASIIVGGANNQLEDYRIGDVLHAKGILYSPDFVVNSGGLISVVSEHENKGHVSKIPNQLNQIVETLNNIYDRATTENRGPHRVAEKIAVETIQRMCKEVDESKNQIDDTKPPYNTVELLQALKVHKAALWQQRGEQQTLKLFQSMARRVPAYTDFLKKNNVDYEKIKTIKDFESIPTIDKENYLKAYSLEDLCWDGEFQNHQWTLFSTSGSTGEPFYFPYQKSQYWQYATLAEMYLRDNFNIHEKKTLYINAFPMGAWIGGVFTDHAIKLVAENGKYNLSIISPGVDKKGIIKAVQKFGPMFDQIIIGSYGPFLKDILDDGEKQGMIWQTYNIKCIFSAEGFTEDFRDYIFRKIGATNIYKDSLNHYGTVDLGTMAHETPLAILIRRLALNNPKLYNLLFPNTKQLPTLTQFLPEMFYFENIDENILCSGNTGIPLVRYNLKDNGAVITWEQMMDNLKRAGVNIRNEITEANIEDTIWHLPFVHVFERSDFSVSFYAFFIYPQTIKKSLLKDDIKDDVTGKFTMQTKHDENQNQYLEINIELKDGVKETQQLKQQIKQNIIEQLQHDSSEYRETYKEKGGKVEPRLVFWPYENAKYFKPGTKQKWINKHP